mmetsp:Transcript_26095/g.51977  ORF Transcript_26095/g.51977 Transcript_26095/m.51977 type:complete len:256 (-) Transcript_26095:371-1138(-)
MIADPIPILIHILRLLIHRHHLTTQLQSRRQRQPRHRQHQHPHGSISADHSQFLDLESQPANETGEAEDEEEVGEHGAKEGELDDAVESLLEGGGGDEKFGCVAEGGVEEGADGLVGVACYFFGDEGESLGQRNQSQSSHDETSRLPQQPRRFSHQGYRTKDQQPRDFIAKYQLNRGHALTVHLSHIIGIIVIVDVSAGSCGIARVVIVIISEMISTGEEYVGVGSSGVDRVGGRWEGCFEGHYFDGFLDGCFLG